MKYVLTDIKRGYKIKTIMKRHDISATLVLACMVILEPIQQISLEALPEGALGVETRR